MVSLYKSGEKPGKGTYKCVKCAYIVVLKSDSDVLPVCPLCGLREYEKLA